jgi:Uma2 family endonuclease
MALPIYPLMTVEEYLVLDRNSQNIRYEYLDGQVRMLAGGSANHSIISANITALLHDALRATPCIVYNSDMRVQLSESHYVYPDVVVSCEEVQGDTLRAPLVVVEVLSPSTEAFDRGWKFVCYRACSSLQDYLLVDSLKKMIELYHREGDIWTLRTYGPDAEVRLLSLQVQFPVAAVYEKVRLLGNS